MKRVKVKMRRESETQSQSEVSKFCLKQDGRPTLNTTREGFLYLRPAGQRFSHHYTYLVWGRPWGPSTPSPLLSWWMDPVSPWSARYLPITTLMLCVVYPDAKLYTRALYTFTISSLMDVSTTWGAQTIRYHVGIYFTTSSFPDVPPLTSPAISTSSTIYSGAVAFSATWPSPSPAAPTSWLSVWRRDPGRRGTGTRRRERTWGTSRGAQLWRVPRTAVQHSEALHSHKPVPISRVATSVLSLYTLLSNILSPRSHLIPVWQPYLVPGDISYILPNLRYMYLVIWGQHLGEYFWIFWLVLLF